MNAAMFRPPPSVASSNIWIGISSRSGFLHFQRKDLRRPPGKIRGGVFLVKRVCGEGVLREREGGPGRSALGREGEKAEQLLDAFPEQQPVAGRLQCFRGQLDRRDWDPEPAEIAASLFQLAQNAVKLFDVIRGSGIPGDELSQRGELAVDFPGDFVSDHLGSPIHWRYPLPPPWASGRLQCIPVRIFYAPCGRAALIVVTTLFRFHPLKSCSFVAQM